MGNDLLAYDGGIDSKSFFHVLYEIIVPSYHILTRFMSAVRGFLLFLLHNPMRYHWPSRLKRPLCDSRFRLIPPPVSLVRFSIINLIK